jgi:branched-chain amino acid transport system permease protein
MTGGLILQQCLNGLQFGLMLFLLSAGLTLVFGIMGIANLAHGSFYMIGAYIAATAARASGSFAMAALTAVLGTFLIGGALEIVVFRLLYRRDHLDQVLATYAVVLFCNELVSTIWGAGPIFAGVPPWLSGSVQLFGGSGGYPVYRLAMIIVGLVIGAALYFVIGHTRLGMLVRAGASNRTMVGALGINIKALYTIVFGAGAALAGLAGLLAGPVYSVQPGMGDTVLITILVVIVLGGIGSVRGSFIAALLVGLVDTMGRAFFAPLLATILPTAVADNAGPAIASMAIYVLMAIILFSRPTGLFGPRTR